MLSFESFSLLTAKLICLSPVNTGLMLIIVAGTVLKGAEAITDDACGETNFIKKRSLK